MNTLVQYAQFMSTFAEIQTKQFIVVFSKMFSKMQNYSKNKHSILHPNHNFKAKLFL